MPDTDKLKYLGSEGSDSTNHYRHRQSVVSVS